MNTAELLHYLYRSEVDQRLFIYVIAFSQGKKKEQVQTAPATLFALNHIGLP